MNIAKEKKRIRTELKKHRGMLDMTSFRTWSGKIIDHVLVLPEFRKAQRIHCYVSLLNNEVDTIGLLYRMFDLNKTVVVPKCGHDSRSLINVHIENLDELHPGKYGLMEPEIKAGNIIKPSGLDLVLAPLVGFDRSGLRLGMGGGFYDGFIAECPCPVAGLAYGMQEIEQVPAEPHDAKLDIIITENEVLRFNHG